MRELRQGLTPVITLWQPYATWIMLGWKTIETRLHNRFQCLAGETVAIHAGATTDNYKVICDNPYLEPEQMKEAIKTYNSGHGFPKSCILGTVRIAYTAPLDITHSKHALIDCGETKRFGLFIDPPKTKKFKTPIPMKGKQGIWYVPTSLITSNYQNNV